MLKLTAALFAVLAAFASGQTQTFQIAGHVVREGGNPVRGARVSIFLSDHPERRVSCISGENGEFSFTSVAAGKYSLQASYHGWTRFYRQSEDFSTGIAAGPGLDSEHIVFPLESPATIAGSVLDEAGDPVRNASVYLFTRSVHNGTVRTELKETKMSATDGAFHFTRLEPGVYYAGVAGRPWYAQGPTTTVDATGQSTTKMPDPMLDVAYPLTFYASATSADGATPIQLEPGARVEIQFHLQPVPALHISFDRIDKQTEQQIMPWVQGIGPGGTLVNVPVLWAGPTGITAVAPGAYLATLNLNDKGKTTQLGSYVVNWTGDTTLDLSENAKTTVSGKVISDVEIPQNLWVLLEGTTNSNKALGSVDHDGSFTMPDVAPGSYNLFLADNRELYIKSATAKGGTYSNDVLQVATGAQIELTIYAPRGLTEVDGTAVRDGKPYAGAMVLLIPKEGNHGKYIPRDQSDSDGTFALQNAAPGHYTLVAIDNGHGLEYANPATMAPYLASGKPVELPLPKGTNVEIEVQPRRANRDPSQK